MSESTRREFLKTSAGAAAAVSIPAAALRAADTANNKLTFGIIGPGGMGTNLLRSFAAMKDDVTFAWVCDVDAKRMADAAKTIKGIAGNEPKTTADMRRLLDDKSVDAVIIATPDHWHGPATILAADAGKHVYVEKPASHNLREGRLMIEAARRNKKVVQVGTQSRSAEHINKAMSLLKGGAIGEVLISKAWNSQLRGNIGKRKPESPPSHLDYENWVGPAPMVPYQSNLLHSSWRWFHNFGTGDMGNDGVHDIDIARWGLGVTTHPSRIAAMGGKLFFDDDQQFPDTQYICFEYDNDGKKKQLIYEQRIWSPYVQEGFENGNAFYGTKGMLILAKHHGWQLFGERNQLREKMDGGIHDGSHHRNFIACIRENKTPAADIEVGHLSSSLCHLGNIATRLGRHLSFDPQKEQILGDEEANRLIKRQYREHWGVPKNA